MSSNLFNVNELLQAVNEAKKLSTKRNFVQSIGLVVNLQDIDLKKPENRFQELVELPFFTGKEIKICVIASREMALKAKTAGADLVIQRDELQALAEDKKKQKQLTKTYDFFIAEAQMMPLIGKILGSTLGPRGKMPTPLPPRADVKENVEKYRKMVRLRLRGQPVLHCRVGDEKMSDKEVAENIKVVLGRIEEKLRRGIKNVRSVYLKSTMGSPVKVNM